MKPVNIYALLLLGVLSLLAGVQGGTNWTWVVCSLSTVELKCPTGEFLDIHYGVKGEDTCKNEFIQQNCYIKELEEELLTSCVGQNSCTIDTDCESWGVDIARIGFSCNSGVDPSQKALLASCAQKTPAQTLSCEQDTHVLHVKYTLSQVDWCRNPTTSKSNQCPLAGVRDALQQACDGRNNCEFPLGYACPDELATWPVRIDYTCTHYGSVPTTTTTTTTTTPKPTTTEARSTEAPGSNKTGAIVGAVVGCLLVIAIVIAIIIIILYRRRKQRAHDMKDEMDPYNTLDSPSITAIENGKAPPLPEPRESPEPIYDNKLLVDDPDPATIYDNFNEAEMPTDNN